MVTAYQVETMNASDEVGAVSTTSANDNLVGMTVVEAEAYAQKNGIDFRTGTIDGVGQALTADFRTGRVTAEVEGGVVVGYTTE